MGRLPADVELRQVQRGAVEAQHTGLLALLGQQHLGLFRQRQLGVAALLGLALAQHAAVGIEHFQIDAIQRLAAFQCLGKHVQAIGVAVHRQADITQGEQRGRLGIIVGARRAHHRQVHTRLLQLLEAGDGQQQGFAGVACRVQVEAAAVDQVGQGQQFAGFITLQAGVAPPLRKEGGQGFGLDAEEFDIDFIDVQRDHRQAFGQARR